MMVTIHSDLPAVESQVSLALLGPQAKQDITELDYGNAGKIVDQCSRGLDATAMIAENDVTPTCIRHEPAPYHWSIL